MKGASISALAGVALSAVCCVFPCSAPAVEMLDDNALQEVVARGEQAADIIPGDLQAVSAAPGDAVLDPGHIYSMVSSGKIDADFPAKLALALLLPQGLFDYSIDMGPVTEQGDHTVKADADGGVEASLAANIAYIRLSRLRPKGAPESWAFGDVEFNDIQFSANDSIRVSFF